MPIARRGSPCCTRASPIRASSGFSWNQAHEREEKAARRAAEREKAEEAAAQEVEPRAPRGDQQSTMTKTNDLNLTLLRRRRRRCRHRRLYRGVRLEPDGRWSAHVLDGDGGEGRLIGHFGKETHAALAHDRVALVLDGGARAINFRPSFSAMERRFLRLRCTEEFVLRAVLDHTYDMEYDSFLRAEFDEYLCGNAGEETARAVVELVARERRWWERHCHDNETAAHSCTEAHEREEKAARLAVEEREKAAAAQEVEPPGADPAIDRHQEEERSEPADPCRAVRSWSGRTLLRSLKRWLPRTWFDDPLELQVPLLNVYGPCSQPTTTS
ncbi:hypothetical protein PR202_gb22148 [Eleusine coracana subsp. coracana]|uniref:AP2/ERF domain-containing protein n=1 Tax=Eleusine coracana subsp. coracana TaxID=191504 RepID=A0AAV5FF03_ELECO|nr:hypothetical protein PR202_gb22148 [Eleusine coracana subsp. coracana]